MRDRLPWQDVYDVQPEMWGEDAGGLTQICILQRMQLDVLRGNTERWKHD